MNREQRRQAQRASGRIASVNLHEITFPQQMTTGECEAMLLLRLSDNLRETGHPFHHRTASGVIVEPDPTLQYFFSRLTASRQDDLREEWQRKVRPDAPKAVPVNRKFYGVDPYERH